MIGYYLAHNSPDATGTAVSLPRLFGTVALLRASDDDLRVLICISQSDDDDDIQSIAAACDITEEKVRESITFWKKHRIIKVKNRASTETDKKDDTDDAEAYGSVADRLGADEKKFAEEMYLIAEKIEKPDANFSESEKECLRSLLSSNDFEYILVLAKYYHDLKGKKFHIAYLRDVIESNEKLGINTAEAFIEYTDKKDSIEYAARRLFGLGTTAFSTNQKKYIDTWTSKYKFDKDIFGFAYDIMADKSQRRTFKYIDTLLTKWYDNGCKTLSDVEKFNALDEAEWSSDNTVKRNPKKQPVKNNSFDVKDAFRKALERSNRMLDYTPSSETGADNDNDEKKGEKV